MAKTASVTLGDVRRAIIRLVAMGVLIKEEKGKYRIHPGVMWRGSLDFRGDAETKAPVLTLVEGGKSD